MKTQVYLYWKVDEWSEAGGSYRIVDSDNYETLWPSEFTLLGSQEVEFVDHLQVDPRERALNALKVEKASIIKEATSKAEKIEEKIQQLLAITNQVEA